MSQGGPGAGAVPATSPWCRGVAASRAGDGARVGVARLSVPLQGLPTQDTPICYCLHTVYVTQFNAELLVLYKEHLSREI